MAGSPTTDHRSRRESFQRHVASALDGQFVILFEQDRAEEAGMMAASLGKMPTTSVRRLISPFRRSIVVRCSLARSAAEKLI